MRLWCAMAASLSLAAFGWIAAPHSAQAQERMPELRVTGGGKPFQVAVQRFAPDPRSQGSVEPFYAELTQALKFAGGFSVIDPGAFLEPKQTQDYARPAIPCDNWKGIGANILVQGVLERPSGAGPQRVRYRVWDMDRCGLRGDAMSQEFPEDEIWLAARRIADEIVLRFTGRRGVAATQIAFTSDSGGNKEVYVMEAADGSRRRRVTSNRQINLFPAWSPDASRLAYVSYRAGVADLWMLGRGAEKGGRLLNLPPNLQALEKWRVVFGPRSNDVTFVMHKDNNTDIFMSEMGGTSLRRLTTHRAIEVSPSWSPDGKRMVFMSDRSGTPQLYILDVESGQERRITYKGEYNASPAWSPTGEWIVYSARTGLENMDIYVIDPESLYSYPVVLHERVDQDPAWSPDGRKIVFSSDRRGKRDIYTVDLDGNNLLRLTSDFGSCTGPSWASWIE
jgi:TolB protein